MCSCFKDGEFTLQMTDRGDICLDLNYKQIDIYDYYTKETMVLLKINYCPICGEKL